MAASNLQLNSGRFDQAVILLRAIFGKEFCQGIFIFSDSCVVELQPFLDYFGGVDFFSIREIHHPRDELERLISAYDVTRAVTLCPFESIYLRIASFYGDEGSLIEISEVRISATHGRYVSLSPDPDRMVADQLYLTGAA